MSIINPCPFCHEKQEEINRLKDEIICLKDRLRHRERTEKEGFFGSSTPSSLKPVKVNTQEKPKKPRGAKNGHEGFGRKALTFRMLIMWKAWRRENCALNAAIPLRRRVRNTGAYSTVVR
jgi:hypothetical protein